MSIRERASVESSLDDVRTAPFDRPSAIEAGTICAHLVEMGIDIDLADVMIAAIARVHEVGVMARDVAHFDRIDGVDVRSY